MLNNFGAKHAGINIKTRNLWMLACWHLDPHANAAFGMRQFEIPFLDQMPLENASRTIPLVINRCEDRGVNTTVISGQKGGIF